MKRLVIVLAVLLSVLSLHSQEKSLLHRGDLVHMKSGSPNYPLRVIAIPGDRIHMDKSGIYVNEMPVTGLSADLIANNPGGDKTIPADHYFVVGERREISETGENLSQTYNFTWGGDLQNGPQ